MTDIMTALYHYGLNVDPKGYPYAWTGQVYSQ